MAYKDWLNEQAAQKDSAKNAGMGMAADLKPEDIQTPKATPALGVPLKYDMSKAPSGGKTEGADTYEAWYATQKEYYDKLYADTLKQISANREKAIIDASAAKGQAMPTYGANAERLASMGLTGGGYSDYLTGQAHAAYRGDVQAANALAAQQKAAAKSEYEQALLGVEKDLYDYQAKQAEAQKEAYKNLSEIYKGMDDGEYNSLDALLTKAYSYGFDKETVDGLMQRYSNMIAEDYDVLGKTEVENEDESIKVDLNPKTDYEIDAMVGKSITEQTATALKKQRDLAILDYIRNARTQDDRKGYILKYSGIMSKDSTQQAVYEYNQSIADNDTPGDVNKLLTDLEKIRDEEMNGSLTKGDADALMAYQAYRLLNATGEILDAKVDGDTITGTFPDGETHTVRMTSSTVDVNFDRALTAYYKGRSGGGRMPKAGDVVNMEGKRESEFYVYDGENWMRAEETSDGEYYMIGFSVGLEGDKTGTTAHREYNFPAHKPDSDTGYSKYLTE